MPHHGHGVHHFRKRKRVHQGLEPYPHPDRRKAILDRALYFVIFLGPIMTIPQVITIWVEKNAAGVSIISWAAYLATNAVWLAYGMMHRDKPVLVSSGMWIALQVVIVVGLGLYG